MNRAVAWAVGCALVLTGAVAVPGATSAAVVFQSGPGQFEVSGVDGAVARTAVNLAVDCWHHLAGPLGLPAAFTSPVFCRLVPAEDWVEATPFRVIVEAGGVVSLRLRAGAATTDLIIRRALVQALLMRLAVAHHGVNERLSAPLWLELACVEWWRTRAEPAQFDALKQASARLMPNLAAILAATRGGAEPRDLAAGAVWLLAFLQNASGRENEWLNLLHRLLDGEEAGAAMAASFPGRYANEGERELWWHTGWHHLRRARTVPALEADESRRELESLCRFVFSAEEGRDVIVPLREVLAHAREPIVAVDLQRRASDLARLLPALHPFFRNAGLSLAAALRLPASGAGARDEAASAFDRDWNDAIELTSASRAALDEWEKRRPRTSGGGPG